MAETATRQVWARRVVGVVLGVSLAGLALGIALVSLFVVHPPSTLWTLEQGLAWYDGQIRGRIAAGEWRGGLREADGLCLVDLSLMDRHARQLASVQDLCLRLDLESLMSGGFVGAVDSRGLILHLRQDALWSDLALPGGAQPSEPEPVASEDAEGGLDLNVELLIEEFELVQHETAKIDAPRRAGQSHPQIQSKLIGSVLEADISGEAGRWSLTLQRFAARSPAPELSIYDIRGRAHWVDAELRLESLELETSRGDIDGARGTWNTKIGTYDAFVAAVLASPEADSPPSAPAEPTGPPDDLAAPTAGAFLAEVEIELAGDSKAAAGQLRANSDQYAMAQLNLATTLGPKLSWSIDGWVYPNPELSKLPVELQGQGQLQEGRVHVHLGQANLQVEFNEKLADVQLAMPGARVRAGIDYGERPSGLAVEGKVVVTHSARALAATEEIIGRQLPDIELSSELNFDCSQLPGWRCDLRATGLRAEDSLRFAGQIRANEGIALGLQELKARIEGQSIELLQPAVLAFVDDELRVEGLALTTGAGSVVIDGKVGSETQSTLIVQVREFDLGLVSRLTPWSFAGILDAEASWQGDAGRPVAELAFSVTELAWRDVSLGEWSGRLDANSRRIATKMRLVGRAGRVIAEARVPVKIEASSLAFALRPHGRLRSEIEIAGFDLSAFAGDDIALNGRLDADVELQGSIAQPSIKLKATGDGIMFQQYEVQSFRAWAEHGLDSVSHLSLRARSLGARLAVHVSAPIHLRPLAGQYTLGDGAPTSVRAEVRGLALERLREFWPDTPSLARIAGHLNVKLDSDIRGRKYRGALQVSGRTMAYEGQKLGDLSLDAKLAERSLQLDGALRGPRGMGHDVEIRAMLPVQPAGDASPLPKLAESRPLDVEVQLAGFDLATGPKEINWPDMSGRARGIVALSGTAAAPKLEIDASVDELRYATSPFGRVSLAADYRNGKLSFELHQRRGRQYLDATGKLPVVWTLTGNATPNWNRSGQHEFDLQAQNISESSFTAFIDWPKKYQLNLAADVSARGNLQQPKAGVRIDAVLASHGRRGTPIECEVDIGAGAQSARLAIGRGPGALALNADTRANLQNVSTGKTDWQRLQVEASAQSRGFQIQQLADFFPVGFHEPEGRLSLDAQVLGSLGSPKMSGSIGLSSGALTISAMNQRFTDIVTKVDFSGPDVWLESFKLNSGDGSVEVGGKAHIKRGDTHAQAKIKIEKLPLIRPGLPHLEVSTGSTISLDARGEMTKLEVELERAFVDVMELEVLTAAQPLPVLDGVLFEDSRMAEEKADEKREKESWVPRATQISLTLVDSLHIRGPAADMQWSGGLRLSRRADGGMSSSGSLSVSSDGYVEFLGNRFDISRGEITMVEDGDIDPFVEFLASTRVEGFAVSLNVHGRASRPELELNSEPSLELSQIFGLLLTGSADAADGDDSDFTTKAAGVLAAFQNPALQRYLRDSIGIDRVGVGFGDELDQPIVNVGKRFSRRVYVEAQYQHNAPEGENSTEVSLEYMIRPPSLSVETFFGDAAAGGVVFWWRKLFGQGGAGDEESEQSRTRRIASE